MITEKFHLVPTSTGITELDGVGATWSADIWDFQPPLGTSLVLKPTDTFAAYLVGNDTVEMPASTQIRIVKRDVTNEQAYPVLTNVYYQKVKDFTDSKKIMHLTIDKEVEVDADEHLVIMVNGADVAGTDDLDASLSHFELITTRRRKPLG